MINQPLNMLMDDYNITKHFRLSEFLIGNIDAVLTSEQLTNVTMMAHRLQVVRDIFGNSVIINSAFRTYEHNREVGGALNSQHLLGKAADIIVNRVSPQEVQKKLHNWSGGLGIYTTFTHLDIRLTSARW